MNNENPTQIRTRTLKVGGPPANEWLKSWPCLVAEFLAMSWSYSCPEVAAELLVRGVNIGNPRCPGWVAYQIKTLHEDIERISAELPLLASEARRIRARCAVVTSRYRPLLKEDIEHVTFFTHGPGPGCTCHLCVLMDIATLEGIRDQAELEYHWAKERRVNCYRLVDLFWRQWHDGDRVI